MPNKDIERIVKLLNEQDDEDMDKKDKEGDEDVKAEADGDAVDSYANADEGKPDGPSKNRDGDEEDVAEAAMEDDLPPDEEDDEVSEAIKRALEADGDAVDSYANADKGGPDGPSKNRDGDEEDVADVEAGFKEAEGDNDDEKKKDDEDAMDEAITAKEAGKLLEAVGLTGKNAEDVKAVFEAAVNTRVAAARKAERKRLEARHAKDLKTEAMKIAKVVDQHVTEQVAKVVKENKTIVVDAIRLARLEKAFAAIMEALTGVNIRIPAEQKDALKEMAKAHAELKTAYAELKEDNDDKSRRLERVERLVAVQKIARDANLAESQTERLFTLTDDLEMGDVAKFKKKVKSVAEAIANRQSGKKPLAERILDGSRRSDQALKERQEEDDKPNDMKKYAEALTVGR